MRVVLTLLVRDEADIIRSNVQYHLAQGIDHVIVADNGSLDGTAFTDVRKWPDLDRTAGQPA